ncbi:MAG TPA: ABC transporter ATP-binding protein [Paralcaligenes sp.]|jgi:ABC-type branched-chain amino acid transport systems, ATPase component
MLRINGLAVSFGSVSVLKNISFECKPGQVTAIIGPNGAGKTTLFDAMTGFTPTLAGSTECGKTNISGLAPFLVARAGLSRTFQTPRLFDRMTVLENLKVAHEDEGLFELAMSALTRSGELRQDRTASSKAIELLRSLQLEHVKDNFAADLSGGQRKLVELGRALMTDPQYILLDEPVAGVAPALVEDIGRRLRELAQGGLGVVLIEHNMDFVMKVSDYVVVMTNGSVLTSGAADEVRADPRVLEAYLSGATEL